VLRGNVSVDTNIGAVRVQLTRAPRRIDARTNVGDVHVAVPGGRYALTTQTTVGNQTIRGLVHDDNAARAIRATTRVGVVTIAGR
jgi:hypothetical protein